MSKLIFDWRCCVLDDDLPGTGVFDDADERVVIGSGRLRYDDNFFTGFVT